MKIVINNAIINTDWFPVITTENNILLFGYESDFNTPIHVYFPSEEDANALAEELEQKYPDCDINMISGEQPVYYYIISIE